MASVLLQGNKKVVMSVGTIKHVVEGSRDIRCL